MREEEGEDQVGRRKDPGDPFAGRAEPPFHPPMPRREQALALEDLERPAGGKNQERAHSRLSSHLPSVFPVAFSRRLAVQADPGSRASGPPGI
jgi:hypothetical protein